MCSDTSSKNTSVFTCDSIYHSRIKNIEINTLLDKINISLFFLIFCRIQRSPYELVFRFGLSVRHNSWKVDNGKETSQYSFNLSNMMPLDFTRSMTFALYTTYVNRYFKFSFIWNLTYFPFRFFNEKSQYNRILDFTPMDTPFHVGLLNALIVRVWDGYD